MCEVLGPIPSTLKKRRRSRGKRRKRRRREKVEEEGEKGEGQGEAGKPSGSWDCCPTLWRPFQSSCYFISTELLSWAESRNSCLAMGADLVVITTKNEQDFIIQNLNIDSDYYVGLLDPEGQNHWQWVDQTPYNQSATFWHTKEPNMLDERCVAVNFRKEESRHWGWNDVHCHIPLKSVCETKICL
ncbi:C-type lectin domain family 4 member C-like isoform X3 [Castor canadensis]|uniref:C-type lectin domain family 4 member C-like isoform X3 n=1 Tax=Castor canadensis TaxID=51338 RepID=A0A8B7U9E8_CASCN